MGWSSCLEDINKRAEELERLCGDISDGTKPYSDDNRKKVSDIGKDIRRQIRSLESLLKQLEPNDQRLLDDVLYLQKTLGRTEQERKHVTAQLKEAYLQVSKLKEERDEEKKKREFTIRKFLDGGPAALKVYLRQLGY